MVLFALMKDVCMSEAHAGYMAGHGRNYLNLRRLNADPPLVRLTLPIPLPNFIPPCSNHPEHH